VSAGWVGVDMFLYFRGLGGAPGDKYLNRKFDRGIFLMLAVWNGALSQGYTNQKHNIFRSIKIRSHEEEKEEKKEQRKTMLGYVFLGIYISFGFFKGREGSRERERRGDHRSSAHSFSFLI